jgi:hypothetical protein
MYHSTKAESEWISYRIQVPILWFVAVVKYFFTDLKIYFSCELCGTGPVVTVARCRNPFQSKIADNLSRAQHQRKMWIKSAACCTNFYTKFQIEISISYTPSFFSEDCFTYALNMGVLCIYIGIM